MTVRASLEPAEIPVSQEGLASALLRLHNEGHHPLAVQIDITGEAAAWSWVTPAGLTLAPGATAEVKATFKAPRTPQPPAGPLPVGLRVSTPVDAEASVHVAGVLHVAPYTDIFLTIEPPVSTGPHHGSHTVRLENRGNAAVDVALAGLPVDASTGLQVELTPSTVTIPSGEQSSVMAAARPPSTFRRGDVRDLAFRGEARPRGGPVTSIGARFRHQPAGSAWPARVVVGLAGLALVGGLARSTVLAPEDPTSPSGASPGDGTVGVRDSAAAGDVPAGDECPAQGHLGGIAHGQAEGATASGYAFLYADDTGCLPIRFPACEAVHYVLNDSLAPPGGVDDAHDAIDRLAEATGLSFVYDGTTDEAVDVRRGAYQPERYGERWAPILIGWSALGTGRGPDTAGDDIIVAGRGNPIRVGDALVSGVLELNADVILDRDTQERLPGGFGSGITRGRVLLHELGHVMGLGHVSSEAQLMYPELAEHTSSTAEFGVGDRVGLRLVGREAGCQEPPPLPPQGAN